MHFCLTMFDCILHSRRIQTRSITKVGQVTIQQEQGDLLLSLQEVREGGQEGTMSQETPTPVHLLPTRSQDTEEDWCQETGG